MRISVIKRQGQSAVVEYVLDGRPQRRILPDSIVTDDDLPLDELERGIQYGAPWAQIIKLRATPEQVETALHQAGIWTYEDLRRNYHAALGALNAAYRLDLSELLRLANSEQNQKG